MLKGLDPVLGPELLAALRGMGHGDEIALVDANYPAGSAGPRVIRLDGLGVIRVLDATLSVLPLDDFGPVAAWHMQVVDDPAADLPLFAAFRSRIARTTGRDGALRGLERFAFYRRVADAFAVVATGETGLYGNLILKKGVIRPEDGPG